jgi:predicted permease
MVATGLYRVLLRCYPAPFRHEYGSEMLAAFASQIREARREGGWWAALSLELETIFDLFITAPKEHYHVTRFDIRYALRLLRAKPGFTIVAVLSLALGIGANTAIFSLLNSVLLSSLPIRDPQSLIMLTDPESSGLNSGSQGGERGLLTYAEFEQLRDRTNVFSSLMACESQLDRLQAEVESQPSEEIRSRMVSNEYFETLGVPAMIGRTLQSGDDLRSPVAIVSRQFWERKLGGTTEALGKKIRIRKTIFTVIGVMPASFFGETVGERPDVWLPLGMQAAVFPGHDYLHDRPQDATKDMWLQVFGRLKPGISLNQAQASANLVFQQELKNFYTARVSADKVKGFLNQHLLLRPAVTGASSIRGQVGGPLKLLLAASALVLLIACANLGNMMLARLTGRTRELAIRSAIGASRVQLVRQVATESLVLAGLGGLASLFTAWVFRIALQSLFGEARLAGSADARVLLFAFGLTLIAGVTIGLIPVLRTLAPDIVTGLKEQGRGLTASSVWLRAGRAIVAGQLALSLPLLVGAGLLLKTLYNLQHVNIGFEKEHVFTFNVDLGSSGYVESQRFSVLSNLLDRVRSTPGVHAATFSHNGLFGGGDSGDAIDVEGYVPKGREDGHSRYEHVGPDFFSTLGVPMRMGREIGRRDEIPGNKICVINQAFAKTYFAGRNPIGLHVTQKFGNDRNTFEIVGVADNLRQNGLRGEVEHRFYVSAVEPIFPLDSATFEVRTIGDASSVMGAVRKNLLSANSALTIDDFNLLPDLINQRISLDRVLGRLSTVFGIVGLLLAAIGLYGVLSYAVGRRTGEIGIRKALGAPEQAVIWMILRETTGLVLIGFAIGLALTAAGTRLINSRLYGLASTDPTAISSAILVLAAVALLASWIPAYRASRVDPLTALRHE